MLFKNIYFLVALALSLPRVYPVMESQLQEYRGRILMAVVETECQGQIMVIRLNRPERMNALGFELRSLMDLWNEFEQSNELEVAIVTGTGKAFCAGEDMKEALERGARQPIQACGRPFDRGTYLQAGYCGR